MRLGKSERFMTDEKYENLFSSLFSEKVLAALDKKQQLINQQLEEIEKRYLLNEEEKKRLINKAENDFLCKMEKNQKQTDETSQRILQRFEDSRIKPQIDEDNIPEGKIIPGERKTRKKRNSSSGIDIVLDPRISDFKSQLARLESVILEAGFTIIESSNNCIKVG